MKPTIPLFPCPKGAANIVDEADLLARLCDQAYEETMCESNMEDGQPAVCIQRDSTNYDGDMWVLECTDPDIEYDVLQTIVHRIRYLYRMQSSVQAEMSSTEVEDEEPQPWWYLHVERLSCDALQQAIVIGLEYEEIANLILHGRNCRKWITKGIETDPSELGFELREMWPYV
ncbi:MAG: hypothetical protein KDD44_08355 [Bdellovibrionales bacterium]|nr:hypothetical protein [Bdellovibrionales bacterium]